jgi:hypothetical protein
MFGTLHVVFLAALVSAVGWLAWLAWTYDRD